MSGVVTAIYRYPVKGLSADPLDRVEIAAGETLPFDRVWAIENGPSRFDSKDPGPVPPVSFLMLMRDERLAALEARFDETTQRLSLFRGGRQVATGILSTLTGRQIIEQFMAAFMETSLRGPPKIVSAPGHNFSDTPTKSLHLISLASLKELERVAGRHVDPLRFRPNVVIDGPAPWTEFGWVGSEISLGDVRLQISMRTDRCAAANVDPKTGARDMAIPAMLQREWGHTDFGVYARVVSGGTLALGAPLSTST